MTRVDAAPGVRAPERPIRGRKAVRAQTELPLPPSDDEKNWYMGRQHRWLLVLQAFTLSLVVFSIGRFALSRPAPVVLLHPGRARTWSRWSSRS